MRVPGGRRALQQPGAASWQGVDRPQTDFVPVLLVQVELRMIQQAFRRGEERARGAARERADAEARPRRASSSGAAR